MKRRHAAAPRQPGRRAARTRGAAGAARHPRSIVFECGCYGGGSSHERCRAVEEHVMDSAGTACEIKSVTMREIDMDGGGVVQSTVELVYSRGDYRRLIPMVDEALAEVGIVAVKALVSSVVSRAAEGAIAGAGMGGIACGAAAQGSRDGGRTAGAALAGMLIGAAIGAIGGSAVKKRVLDHVAFKQSGRWIVKRLTRPR